MRQRNRSLILRQVHQNTRSSRQEIAQRLGLTQASVSRIVRELIECGLLVEGTSYGYGEKAGRPYVELRINREGAFIAAVCLSAFASQVSLINLTGERLATAPLTQRERDDPRQAVTVAASFIMDQLDARRATRDRLLGVGIAVAGSVDPEIGHINTAPLLGWRDVDLSQILQTCIGVPVCVQNVANAIAVFEHWLRSNEPPRDLLVVHVAVGMGASLLLGGHLIRPAGDEGAVGHVPAIGESDIRCWCGKTGCLDSVVSGRAIVHSLPLALRHDICGSNDSVDAQALHEAIRLSNLGHPQVMAAFEHAGYVLGRTLVTLRAAAAPEAVLVSGPVTKARAYADAVSKGYHDAVSPAGNSCSDFQVKDLEYLGAAEAFGLNELVFGSSLDLSRLGRSTCPR